MELAALEKAFLDAGEALCSANADLSALWTLVDSTLGGQGGACWNRNLILLDRI
jgi:uncharacterized protein (UPF0548 family)